MVNHRWNRLVAETFKFKNVGDVLEGKVVSMLAKDIGGDLVPAIQLITMEGEYYELLMGGWALMKLWHHPDFQIGCYVAIRYDGLSKTIQKAGNFARLYSFVLYPKGKWSYSEDGEFEGEPVSMEEDAKAGKPSLSSLDVQSDYTYMNHPNSDEDFNPDEPVNHGKVKANKK